MEEEQDNVLMKIKECDKDIEKTFKIIQQYSLLEKIGNDSLELAKQLMKDFQDKLYRRLKRFDEEQSA